MGFFKQLWLLIWKNLSLRRRQLLRNGVEAIWPLAIFLILAIVRTSKKVEYKKQLFFKPRAMPSAGALPFMQSFLCDYDNPFSNKKPIDLPDYSNTSFYKLAEDLSPILQNRTNLELISNLQDDYNRLLTSLRDLRALDPTGLTGNASLNQILRDPNIVRQFIKNHTTFNETYIDSVMNGRINFTQAMNFYQQIAGQLGTLNIMKILTLSMSLRPMMCGTPGVKSLFIFPDNINPNIVQNQLCSLSTTEWNTLMIDIYRNIDLNALNRTLGNTDILDTYRKRRKVIEDEINQLIRDVRPLRSFENVLRDLQSAGLPNSNNTNTDNVANRTWEMATLLCGRKRGSTSSIANMNSTLSTLTDKGSGGKTSTYTCSNTPVKDRTECGWKRITQGSCLSMGCCFDKSTKGPAACFCKPGNEYCCQQFHRLASLVGGQGYNIQNLLALILRGKIFYTPDTPQTRKVVEQANLFIKQIERGIRSVTRLKRPLASIINLTETYHNTSNSIRELVNLDLLRVLVGANRTNQIRSLFNQTDRVLTELYNDRSQLQMAYNTIDLIGGIIDCYNITDYFQPFPDEETMVRRATDQAPDKPMFLSSIVFLNFDAKNGSFPKKAEYKLRLNPLYTPATNKIRSRYWRPGPSWNGYMGSWTKFYVNFGFVYLQDMLDRAIMEIITNQTILEPGVYTQQFPYPCYIRDEFTVFVSGGIPLFMVIAWVFHAAMIIKSIVYEKESRLKEVMKVMGLSNSVHWAAWFITSLLFILISVILLCIVMKVGNVLLNSNPLIVFWVLASFGIATISLSCLISVFFSNANISAACGGIIYLATYLPFSIIIWFEDKMTYSHKAVANLLSTTGLGMACRYLARWEEQGEGAQWSNYYKSTVIGDDYSLGTCVNMMLLDALLYMIILWYIENIMPGQYGIPRRWYFPFTKSYWLGSRHRKSFSNEPVEMAPFDGQSGSSQSATPASDSNFEADPNLKVGVNIQNLVKIFRRGNKRAVDGLSLKLYEGQVTSLLGHNGAGKSTTMSVLTGLYPPTKGTAVVYGSDIRTDIEGVRKGLGICPQHNVLFDHLTVEEHMWFYAQLKGMPKEDIKEEIEKFIVDVGLPKKRHELSRNLSGGMKRKLSVALAFIADSKTVILDEPTAGIDPYSRRGIWDLILSYKKGKTILLSTHYMDEADLLGDRIGIISHGRLRCSGTPLFLKRRFGEGYNLTFSKSPCSNRNSNESDAALDENAVMSFVTSYVKGSSLKRSTGTELCFVLPPEERQTGAFEILFQTLEKGSKSLGVSSYGLSDTSLEEVFLKVTEGEDDDSVFHGDDTISLTGPAQRRISSLYDTESLYSVPLERNLVGIDLDFDDATNVAYTNKKEGLSLWIQQFFALLVKRFHHARRGKKGFLSQILLPALFVAVAMGVSLVRPPRVGMPSLKLSPSQFGEPNYAFISNLQRDSKISHKVAERCVKSPGLGIDCAKPAACSEIQNKYPFASAQQRWNFTSTHAQLPTCSCAKGLQTCPKNSYGPAPPMQQLNTKDTLIDLTGRDVNEYLLKSTDEFVKRRYGGITVGDMLKYYPNTNFNANYSSRTASTSRNLSLGFSATGVQLNAKAWFNNKGYHSLPTYLNVLNNAIFRANLKPNQDPREYGIVAYNHPMDFNKEQLGDETLMQGFADLLVSIFVIVALSFVPSSFVVYLVSDRSSKSKHLQLVSGLNPIVYWLANYTWDMINYLIPATSCIIIFLAFNQESYVSATNFPATLCLLLLYGWSMTPLMYPSSFFFDVPSTAYIVLICLNLFIGVVGTISTFILEFFKDDQAMQNINKYLKQVLLIFPNFCLGRGFMDLARNQFTANVFAVFGESKLQDPLSWDVTGKNIFAMFVGGIIFFLFTLLMQYNFFIKSRPGETEDLLPKTEEEDVAKERMRILSEESEENDVLRTINLTKIYKGRFSKKKLLAVDRLSFGLGKGECFGLLGVNGAGKTTTFKMLTGDTSVTAGNAFVGKYSILKDVNKARDQLGYCPQFDAFDELLTAREMLTYYASIRGIRRQFIPQIAEWGISMMDLTLYADKICGDYSGGNKRKLSTSIAFLGNPQLIFLDEPTTGMDPGARRFLWNIIVDIVKTGRSVVFTSHSMEECEALCTRLGIMVNGSFVCFGSPQHLRSKYGDGYTITVRAKLEELTSVDNFMKANFPSSVLKDQHHYMLEYQVPSLNLLLSEVFAKLEILRSTNTITDYSVTQTTLDQIFVNFARKQTEGVELTEDTSLTMHEIQRATTEVSIA